MRQFNKETFKNTIQMAWPAIVESVFIQLAGLIDSLMVSSMGAAKVAAVGITTQPKFMGFAIFFATNIAVSALIARRRGEKKQEDANRILITTLTFTVILAVILSIILVLSADTIMRLCGSTEETHADAVIYFRIIMGCMIFNCIQMAVNSAQRGAGNTRITMRTNLTSNTVNIVFNYLLIGGHFGFPAWGIHGAAIATVLGTVVASVMSVISICKPDGFISIPYLINHKIKPAFSAFRSLVHVGYSIFFEQILMRFGFMATSVMAAHQGTAAMAAHQVAMNLLGVSFAFGDGVQSAAVALIGKSLGENKPDLAKEYGRACQFLGSMLALTLGVVYFLGANGLMSLFFKEAYIVQIGVSLMLMSIIVLQFQIRQVIYMGCLRGAGDTAFTAKVSIFSASVVRTVGSYIGGYLLGFGIVGIWFGIVFDQLGRYILSLVRFKKGRWVNIKI